MSKVLVDRELLLQLFRCWDCGLEVDNELAQLRIAAARPAEAEGVSNARLMNTLAELARRAPLRTLHTICETQHQVSTVKLERYLGPVGDTLAGYAFTLRTDFDKLSAALSAVTAERDRLRDAAGKAIAWLDAEQNESGVGINRRIKLCRDAENSLRAAMAAKEA